MKNGKNAIKKERINQLNKLSLNALIHELICNALIAPQIETTIVCNSSAAFVNPSEARNLEAFSWCQRLDKQ